jgi:4-carboxymuconolactone decarboxylase
MSDEALPQDIDPESRCRLLLPDRDELDEDARKASDSLANPKGGSLAGLRGPGGIRLHSPELSRGLRPANIRLRDPDVIDARTRELAILITAREHDC